MTMWYRLNGTDATPATFVQVLSVILCRQIHDQASAFAHMKREQAKAPRASLLWPLQPTIDALINNAHPIACNGHRICDIGFQLLLACTAFALLDYVVWTQFDTTTGLAAWGLELLLCSALFGIASGLFEGLGVALLLIGKIKIRPPAEWKFYAWDDYIQLPGIKETIPARVFKDVEVIRKNFRGTKISAGVLEQGLVTLDPVLRVAFTNPVTGTCEFAYPDIWDENRTLIEPH